MMTPQFLHLPCNGGLIFQILLLMFSLRGLDEVVKSDLINLLMSTCGNQQLPLFPIILQSVAPTIIHSRALLMSQLHTDKQ